MMFGGVAEHDRPFVQRLHAQRYAARLGTCSSSSGPYGQGATAVKRPNGGAALRESDAKNPWLFDAGAAWRSPVFHRQPDCRF
jgi:hypothetical protein